MNISNAQIHDAIEQSKSKQGRKPVKNPSRSAIRVRRHRHKKKWEAARRALTIKGTFPAADLQEVVHEVGGNPNKDNAGNKDNSGNLRALNLTQDHHHHQNKIGGIKNQKVDHHHAGSADVGLCGMSKKNRTFITNIQESIAQFIEPRLLSSPTWYTLRILCITGVQTIEDTDSFRGCTPSYVMFHKPGCGIRIRLFPLFKSSVCFLYGKRVIPFSFSRADNSLMVLVRFASTTRPQKVRFPAAAIDDLVPCGTPLPFAVAGVKGQKLQICRFDKNKEKNPFPLIESSQDLETVSMDNVLDVAGNGCAEMPHQTWRTVAEPHKWHSFYSWQHVHEFKEGCDPLVSRTHVFFQQIRSAIPGGNFDAKHQNAHDLRQYTDSNEWFKFLRSNAQN